MKLDAGTPIKGTKIDVAFIGSCTNGRLSDFREVAKYIQGHKVAPGVKAIVVPGSQIVAIQCRTGRPRQDLHRRRLRMARRRLLDVPRDESRQAHRRPALRLVSNRNFKGRQGSPTGRTVLMSPVMVAAAAINGHISDARELFDLEATAAVA